MNKLIRKLAEEAGFVFWQDESWKPDGAIIDWSSNYDEDLVRYTELLLDNIKSVVSPESAKVIDEFYNSDLPEPAKMETIEVEFTDAELLEYMKMAHERDITFNQFVQQVLQEYLDQETLR